MKFVSVTTMKTANYPEKTVVINLEQVRQIYPHNSGSGSTVYFSEEDSLNFKESVEEILTSKSAFGS